MSYIAKCQLLNELIEPLGYGYMMDKDIFFTVFDAWQREFGYTKSYDCFAPYFNMVFDCEPIYFDYDNRTWLIEFWKGQYGINTGAEIGIYCADEILTRDKISTELFHAISDEEMPLFSINIKRKDNCHKITDISMFHWWLAAFCMGYFSKPDNLIVDIGIKFKDYGMMYAFYEELIRKGYDRNSIRIYGSHISFTFDRPKTPAPCRFFTKHVKHIIQIKNRFCCKLYLFVTRPFCTTLDRLIYLYFYLPLIFRRCLIIRRNKQADKMRRKRIRVIKGKR